MQMLENERSWGLAMLLTLLWFKFYLISENSTFLPGLVFRLFDLVPNFWKKNLTFLIMIDFGWISQMIGDFLDFGWISQMIGDFLDFGWQISEKTWPFWLWLTLDESLKRLETFLFGLVCHWIFKPQQFYLVSDALVILWYSWFCWIWSMGWTSDYTSGWTSGWRMN